MRRLKILLVAATLTLALPVAAASGGGNADHGGGHADTHAPTFDDINWYYGMLSEKEGVEPSLLFRPVGMPAPFGALLLNSAILYFILYRIFRKPISEGLVNRKASILRGMEEAARMKSEAEQQLAKYEAQFAGVDQDVQRIQREMRASGEAERARVLAEARQRRERMERDARVLIEQELKAIREQLARETLQSALRSAEQKLRERLSHADQQAFAEEYLRDVMTAAPALRGRL